MRAPTTCTTYQRKILKDTEYYKDMYQERRDPFRKSTNKKAKRTEEIENRRVEEEGRERSLVYKKRSSRALLSFEHDIKSRPGLSYFLTVGLRSHSEIENRSGASGSSTFADIFSILSRYKHLYAYIL